MKFLSERIGYSEGKEDLLVRIKASKKSDVSKLWWMRLWVVAWFIAGGLLFWQMIVAPGGDIRLFIIIILAFWAYFAYVTTQAYFFWKYGFETLYIQNGQVMIRKDILERQGRPQYFRVQVKNPFILTSPEDRQSLLQIMAFWVPGAGSIQLGNGKNRTRFGIGLSDNEAKELIKLLNRSVNSQLITSK